MNYKNIIKDNINFYLKKNNKMQKDLVKDLNLSSGLVSNWCTGYRTPTIEHLSMLANYFGIDIIHFFIYDNQNLNELFEIIQKLEPKHQELLKKQAHTLYINNNKNIAR